MSADVAVGPLVAVVVAGAGIAANVVAQVAPSGGAELGPWVSGGSATIAVGALVWVTKKLTSGDLVARPTADNLERLEGIAKGYERQAARLHDTIAEGNRREDRLIAYLESKGTRQ